MTRFLIVDDHPLFREALQSAVRLVHGDADIFEATSIEGALDVIEAHKDFDLALLDLSLARHDGVRRPDPRSAPPIPNCLSS